MGELHLGLVKIVEVDQELVKLSAEVRSLYWPQCIESCTLKYSY